MLKKVSKHNSNNALVVKLVDTKDLKDEGFTDESVRGSLT